MFLINSFLVFSTLCLIIDKASAFINERPPIEKRTYTSKTINDLIEKLSPLFQDADLAILFGNTFPNTLDTTVYYSGKASTNIDGDLDSFIITGDIDALWLRDSANQVVPYLPYLAKDNDLQALVKGLISRHARSVTIDSFANSFNFNNSGEGHQSDMRKPPMTKGVFEGKYEIDSLCAFFKLSYWYYYFMGEVNSVNDFVTTSWLNAANKAVVTIQTMINDDGRSKDTAYLFQRSTTEGLDTLIMQGRGPVGKKNGLSRSLFRPSDDAVTMPYNIPGNAMACVELNHLSAIITSISVDSDLVTNNQDIYNKLLLNTKNTMDSICITMKAMVDDNASFKSSSPLPYELDGFGGSKYMDDANLPSLLALPQVGYISKENPVYKKTREFVLSTNNPFYFTGLQGQGIGGPHEGLNMTWPMAIVAQAMTSDNDDEIKYCLDLLIKSSANTGFMHEAFNVDNVNDYTRSWFAWANGLFGELILQLINERPNLIIKSGSIEQAQELVYPTISEISQKSSII